MNAFSLRELVKRRVPGYDDTEYLSEINDVYEEVWQEIQQLDEMYFADIAVVTTTSQSDLFDLVWNMYGNLSSSLPRLHQIHRIRIKQPGDVNFQPVSWSHANAPEYMGRQTQTNQPAQTTPPYYVAAFGEGSIKFAQPLPVNVQLEIWYTFKCLDLQILNAGSVSVSGNVVTGQGTFFTQLVPADMQQYLPSPPLVEVMIEADITINGQTYRVNEVDGDTQLLTDVAPPVLSNASYVLSGVPEFPPSIHRLIATLATRNILTTPAEDERFGIWAARAEQMKAIMKNTMIQRQRQEPPKKGRFPYGISRRARYYGVK